MVLPSQRRSDLFTKDVSVSTSFNESSRDPEHHPNNSQTADIATSSNYGESDDEDFESYQTDSVAETALENGEYIVNRLFRLSFKIRNPATRLGFTKARNYHQIDHDTGIDLIDQFAIFDHNHIEEVFARLRHISCHEAKEHYLVERLAKANTRRRQQFRQWRKHRVKLETGNNLVAGTSALYPSTLERPEKIPLLEVTSGPGVLVPSIPSTATRVDQSKIDLHDNSSIISSSTYAILSKESHHALAVPQLPKNVLEKKEFECPYCCVICSQRTGKEAWE